MAWPRRLALALVTLALGAGLWRAAAAQTPAGASPAPSGVAVEVELVGGAKLSGTAPGGGFPVEADYGLVSLDAAKVKTLDFAEREGGGRSVVATLVDKSVIAGRVPAEERFRFTAADGTAQAIPAAKLERVKFLHPKDTSWAGVILGLLTLTLMEIILGVDNVIFLAIQADKLPEAERPRARTIGLAVALGTRIVLLLTLSFILGLTKPVFTLPHFPFPLLNTAEERGISWRDIILLVGGAYLIYQSVREMHEKLENARATGATGAEPAGRRASFAKVITTIALMDILFSLDSVITAVGMVDDVPVMIAAMVVAMGVMLVFAGPIGRFVNDRPTVKVLALSFLILIGVLLVAEGLGQHVEKGYIYFAMAFAVGVELVNLQLRGKKPAPAEVAAPASVAGAAR